VKRTYSVEQRRCSFSPSSFPDFSGAAVYSGSCHCGSAASTSERPSVSLPRTRLKRCEWVRLYRLHSDCGAAALKNSGIWRSEMAGAAIRGDTRMYCRIQSSSHSRRKFNKSLSDKTQYLCDAKTTREQNKLKLTENN